MRPTSKRPDQSLSRLTEIVFVLAVLFASIGLANAANDPPGQITHTVALSTDDLVITSDDFGFGGPFDLIRLRGEHSYVRAVGRPMLPVYVVRLALPPGMRATAVTAVETETTELDGEYEILPLQIPRCISGEADCYPGPAAFAKHFMTYQSDDPYPGKLVELVRHSDLAGQSIAHVALYPLQYVPAAKTVTLHTSITISVEYAAGHEYGDFLPATTRQQHYETKVKRLVVNPQGVQLQQAPPGGEDLSSLTGGPYEHVIICRSLDENAWQRLADWHTRRGLRDRIVSTSWIYSNYSGADDEERIRNFVKDAHQTWQTLYFLLAGEDADVPSKYRTYFVDSAPSDEYYADYDDDWEYEVYVGRATARGATEVNLFIDKVLKYEQDPDTTNCAMDVTLLGMDLDAASLAEAVKQDIHGSLIPSGFNVTTVYDSQTSSHWLKFKNALNGGQNLVNHYDHSNTDHIGTGSINHGSHFFSSDVDNLVNSCLSNVVSAGCWALAWDYDSVGEHFVVYNPLQAGVSFTGNTRSGWYEIGDPFALSGELDYRWWESLFVHDEYILGEILASAKHQFHIQSVWYPSLADVEGQCHWELNLLGEPAMPLWTADPQPLEASHPSIAGATGTFDVHVTSSGLPVAGVYMVLWKGDEVYLTGFTDTDGDVSFSPSPNTPGTMFVTGTKRNHVPYLGSAEVDSAPHTPLHPLPVDGATGQLIDGDLGWDGGDPDSGDTVTYHVYLGTVSAPPLHGTITAPATQTRVSYDPGILEPLTRYYWKIRATDQLGQAVYGDEWEFITSDGNRSPNPPSSPSPPDDSGSQSIYSRLSWNGGDPDAEDVVTYEIYFGVSSPPPLLDSFPAFATLSHLSFDPGILNYETRYYWRIKSTDDGGSVTWGPEWDFTTAVNLSVPPHVPSAPLPRQNDFWQGVDNDLTWNGGDPDPSDTVTYEVYLGTTNPPPLHGTLTRPAGLTRISYDPGPLLHDRRYYWKVKAVDNWQTTTWSSGWYFTTQTAGNLPPAMPSEPFPLPEETDVDYWTSLCWRGGDPDEAQWVDYDVYIGTTSLPAYSHTFRRWGEFTHVCADPGELELNTRYYWIVMSRDDSGARVWGPQWSFRTTGASSPPTTPSNPDPTPGTTNRSCNANLSWDGGDPEDEDTVTYTVYLGANPSNPLYHGEITQRAYERRVTYEPGTLFPNIHYYWRIKATDQKGTTTWGPIWDFTTLNTVNTPPETPMWPRPYNGATNQRYHLTLEWYGGDQDPGDIVSYDVYFGTSSNPPFRETVVAPAEQTQITWDSGWHDNGATYYWKIVARDDHGAQAPGSVWSFTTRSDNDAPYRPTISAPYDGTTDVGWDPYLKVGARDRNKDLLLVTFYDASDDSVIGSGVTGYFPKTEVVWPGLQPDTTYHWYAVSSDGPSVSEPSPVSSFTTATRPPDYIYSDRSVDGAIQNQRYISDPVGDFIVITARTGEELLYYEIGTYVSAKRVYFSFDTSQLGDLTGKTVRLAIRLNRPNPLPAGSRFRIYCGQDAIGPELDQGDWDSCPTYTGHEVDAANVPYGGAWYFWDVPALCLNTHGHTDFRLAPVTPPWGDTRPSSTEDQQAIVMPMTDQQRTINWPHLEVVDQP